MKIAVLGATGMLGSMLVNHLSRYFQVVATVRSKEYKPLNGTEVRYLDAMNSEDEEELAGAIVGCQWVINAIGIISQREGHPAEAFTINSLFPKRLQLISEIAKSQVIQIATDCVYCGDVGNYTELDIPSPIDTYGESKRRGEITAPNMHHLRCSLVGPETHGKSLLGWFLSHPEGASAPGYTNHQWNGVTTLHFAKICRGIIENSIALPHLQHLVPADSVSKCILLKLFAREFGRGDIVINPVQTRETIYRTLATTNSKLNQELWQAAGYDYPPTIARMVRELAEYGRGKSSL